VSKIVGILSDTGAYRHLSSHKLIFPVRSLHTAVLPNTLSWLTLSPALNKRLLYGTLMCACKHTPMTGYN